MATFNCGLKGQAVCVLDGFCVANNLLLFSFLVFFLLTSHRRVSPPDSQVSERDSGQKTSRGRELASPGFCLLFFSFVPSWGMGKPKPVNSCLEIENL